MEEVLAIRLYSGPAYQPINTFLRQISTLTGDHRKAMANHAGLTFAATVRHICCGIRKLAAVVTPEEATQTLWRGVRGEALGAGLGRGVRGEALGAGRRLSPIPPFPAPPQPTPQPTLAHLTASNLSFPTSHPRRAATIVLGA